MRSCSDAGKRTFMPIPMSTTGTDTTKIKTVAVRKGDKYVVNGQKVWISRIQHSDLMILLARTTPLDQVKKKSEGMSIFLVDLKHAIANGMSVRPILNMVNHETNELFFDNLEIPVENLIGEEGKGFKYILDGLNAERTLIAAECIGDGYWFIDKAAQYAKERIVFDRPIGMNQGVQFPIADIYMELKAANRCASRPANCLTPASPAARMPTWRNSLPPRHPGKPPTSVCKRTVALASPANTTSSASSEKRVCTRSRRFQRT